MTLLKPHPGLHHAIIGLAIVLLVSLPCRVGRAGNDDQIMLGNDAALLGGAVTAVAHSGSALWYNPAGLAFASFDALDVSANAFTLRLVRADNLLSTLDGETTRGDYTEVLAVPSALTYLRPVSKKLVLALGVFVPQLNEIDLNAVLDSNGPPQTRWVIAIQGARRRYHFAAGLGWRFAPTLHLGATFSLIYDSLRAAIHAAGLNLDQADNPSFLSLTEIDLRRSLGFELRLGAVWAPWPSWRFGLSVRSPGLFIANVVDTIGTAGATISVGAVRASDAGIATTEETEFGFEILNPVRVRAGIAFMPGNWIFSLDGDVQSGVTNEELDIDRDATWNARFGTMYVHKKRWSFGMGLFTDHSGNKETEEVAADFYGVSGGVRFDNVRKLAKNEPQDKLHFSTTFAVRYAYGSGRQPALAFPPGIVGAADIRSVVSDISVHEITLHIGSGLYF